MAKLGDSEVSQVLQWIDRAGVTTVGELEAGLGFKLKSADLRRLAKDAALLLGPGRLKSSSVFHQAICLAPLGRLDEALGSDKLLTSLLRVKRLATTSTAFSPTDVKKLVPTHQQPPLHAALQQRIASNNWPDGVGAVKTKNGVVLFFLEDSGNHARTSTAPASRPVEPSRHDDPALAAFTAHFARAFAAARQQLGGRNLVPLRLLREALPTYDRTSFEQHLNALRRLRQYSLSPHEGRSSMLSPDDEAAGIHEAGRLLVYVARRDDA
ncbi:MAG: hypothetical protein JW940_17785 [Polyangiaceae bacterium]|nr:hypothetical protein [Polyangiaceae bacterium]